METLPHEADVICAHLLREGYLEKKRVPNLELDEQLFQEVKNRLKQVGMELVYNSYSAFYAVRLSQEMQESIEQSNNLGLKNNEIAMLIILWSKLILPKRLSDESPSGALDAEREKGEEERPKLPREPQESSSSQPPPSSEEKKEERLTIGVQELYAEFGDHFGSKTMFKAILTRLSKLKFINIHNEIISEGILLDLLIDGYQMANEIKKSALAFKLAGIKEEEEEWEEEE